MVSNLSNFHQKGGDETAKSIKVPEDWQDKKVYMRGVTRKICYQEKKERKE